MTDTCPHCGSDTFGEYGTQRCVSCRRVWSYRNETQPTADAFGRKKVKR